MMPAIKYSKCSSLCFVCPCLKSLELDDPFNSKGKNPDVLAKIDGTIWGFACKTPNGSSAKTMFERLEEGVDQIEVSRAQRGTVYFNFRNVIDHEQTWTFNSSEIKLV